MKNNKGISLNERYLTGYFSSEVDLRSAADAVCAKGFKVYDIYTPYSVHGIESAVGFSRSRLASVGFGAGTIGLILSIFFQYWTTGFDWPLIVGGKPLNSWSAFFPVIFESTVLFAGVIALIALFLRTRLRPGRGQPVIPEGTDHLFILVLKEEDASFNQEIAERLFLENGALKFDEGIFVGNSE
ncbi:MAG TPA: DUF3341 domain-containing protein [bacterium]|nr:DUF3341 domain-containing protein [bacterium]